MPNFEFSSNPAKCGELHKSRRSGKTCLGQVFHLKSANSQSTEAFSCYKQAMLSKVEHSEYILLADVISDSFLLLISAI